VLACAVHGLLVQGLLHLGQGQLEKQAGEALPA
jgi:hypothetical protein